jgi:cobalamin biosynthesis Mg chelatase CobN
VSKQRPPDAEETGHDVDRRLDVQRCMERSIPPLIAIVQLFAREAQHPAEERCTVSSSSSSSSAASSSATAVVIVVAVVVVVIFVVVVVVVRGFIILRGSS